MEDLNSIDGDDVIIDEDKNTDKVDKVFTSNHQTVPI